MKKNYLLVDFREKFSNIVKKIQIWKKFSKYLEKKSNNFLIHIILLILSELNTPRIVAGTGFFIAFLKRYKF